MLPSQARLTESKGFKTVYNRGRSCASDLIVVYVLPRPGGTRVRFGFSVGKKVGGAVQRNRAKRLLREAARALLQEMAVSCDVVVVARRNITGATLPDVYAHLRKLLDRARMLVCSDR